VWRDSINERAEIGYWRTAGGREIDFIVERKRQKIVVEVKATNTPGYRDALVAQDFVATSGAAGGLVLHGGEQTWWIANKVLATPWWKVI
jgi:predicted AAA+ superfamily ATPase